jgi:hypothetical protein
VKRKIRARVAKVRQPSDKKFQEEKERVATNEGMPTQEVAEKRQQAADEEREKSTHPHRD